jgi:hypothetical protein
MATEKERLRDELRAARETLVQKRRGHPHEGGPVLSPSTQFPWLQTLSEAELEDHIQRLERDLRDIGTSYTRNRETRSASYSSSEQMTLDELTEEPHQDE